MGNNCPTTEWRSWKDVPKNSKKVVMDELLMLNLISNWWVASRGSQTPYQGGNVAATSTPDMAKIGVLPVAPLGPTVCTAAESSTSSVTHLVLSAQWTHR
ncbi:hypothetical protein D8674_021614 [Pyrus ussuriensis x Pyrus communis]|uniref:Uncharacterized protein n=1 Tax=Pyrus ussuriensis x Pyrus communis TaxID=2448454 RepID=A0A5N5GHL8_9ROSA|nr:hypothetical protein D8674_021614 [Pyrus ussuriensis x Pyrus communis]